MYLPIKNGFRIRHSFKRYIFEIFTVHVVLDNILTIITVDTKTKTHYGLWDHP